MISISMTNKTKPDPRSFHDASLFKFREYPLSRPEGFGASADFFTPAGSRLVVSIPELKAQELDAIENGITRMQFITEGPAMVFSFLFQDKNKQDVLVLNAPFDARKVENLTLPGNLCYYEPFPIVLHVIEDTNDRLMVARTLITPSKLTDTIMQSIQVQLNYKEKEIDFSNIMKTDPSVLHDKVNDFILSSPH